MATLRDGRLTDLLPDEYNANRGTERGGAMLERSIAECGLGRSIVTDRDGRVIGGNKTLEAVAASGLDRVVIVETDGRELVVVQRTDLDLRVDPQARRLATFDNRAGQVGLDWDVAQLALDIQQGLDYAPLFHPDELDRMCVAQGVVVDASVLQQLAGPAPPTAPPPGTSGSPAGGLSVQGQPSGRNSALGGSAGNSRDREAAISCAIACDQLPVEIRPARQVVTLEISVNGLEAQLSVTAEGAVVFLLRTHGEDVHTYCLNPNESPSPEASQPPNAPDAPERQP